jgi:50S ribosomal subunit-associated GTPase HflX
MKTATYLAAMARAHIAPDPPLSANELAALKHSVAVLSELGTLLAQSARHPALSGPGLEEVRQTLSRTRAAVAALEQRTHEFAKASLMAWESRFE